MHLMAIIPDLNTSNNETKPIIKHECRELPEPDEVEKYIQGVGLLSRLKRWFTRKRILAPSHQYAQTYLKSQTAIKYEISNHIQKYPYMIHPFSSIRKFWDIIQVICTLIALILTPFYNAFFFNNSQPTLGHLWIVDFVLLFDVIIHFFIGYYDRVMKKVILDPRVVSIKYATGFFIFDLLSAIPIEIFDFFIHGHELHWYCSALNFTKILRLRNVIIYLGDLHKSYRIVSFRQTKIVKATVIILIFLHWATCLVYYIPLVVLNLGTFENGTSESWIFSESMKKRNTMLKKYILCMNRATISLVSSDHYLDVKTPEDMIVNFTLSVLGKLGFIYILAQFLRIMSTFDLSNKERLRILNQLQEYVQYKELPDIMRKRLLVYCNYWYKKNFNRDKHILAQVSEPLREEIILHNYKKVLETVEIFKYLPQSAILKLVTIIEPEIYLSSDVIVKSGNLGDSMYFVKSGTVAVYSSFGKEICHLEDGSYFGEIALIMENETRIANVVAIETCEILKISRESFLQIIEGYPNLLSHMQKIAFKQLGKIVPLDEIYRLQDSSPNYVNISNISGKSWK